MRSRAAVLIAFAGLAWAQQWQMAQPGYRYEFPRDHFAHLGYQTEWWYYTGNLRGADGHRYGFELTFFRQGQHFSQPAERLEDSVWRPDQVYVAHLALSDIDGKSFYHTERLNRAGPGIAGASEMEGAYWNGNWEVKWVSTAGEKQQLRAVCDRFTLDLTLTSQKQPVIQGQDGVSRKGPAAGQASHYVSLTRLEVAGRLTRDGAAKNVTGLAWMDHEFFTETMASDLTGWDWVSIQLNNGEELMLYRLRNKAGQPDRYSSGTYIDSQGRQKFLSSGDFSLTPSAEWRSPHSGARYPQRWRIQVPSLQVDLEENTELPDQELWDAASVTPTYWEGAVSYKGTVHAREVDGVGYLEMTGYQKSVQLGTFTTPAAR